MPHDRRTRDWSQLTIPNDRAYVPIAQSFACGVARHMGFGDDDVRRIELAVEEAVANVIEHAFASDEVAHFDVSCRRVASGLEIRIHDDGLPYDPTLEPEYDPAAALDAQEGAGLGGFLMKRVMDEYEFRNLGAEGKETRLVKYLSSLNITEEDPGADTEIVETPTAQPKFEIRQMRREEAIEVARCVYDAYGYSYPNEHIYYPDRVAAMNESGDLLSAVAVSESGDIGGHMALVFHEHLPPELAIAVVKKKFRGCRLATRLGEFITEQAQRRDATIIHGRPVTVHPYSQQFCQKHGFIECGFLLAHSPKTQSFKGIADEPGQRNSDIVAVKFLAPPKPVTIYPPARHAEIIRSLYAGMDVPVVLGEAAATTGKETVMRVSVNTARSVAETNITRYGTDAINVIKRELRRIRRGEVRIVEMFLDLTDPVTAEIVPEIEDLGFFFTGIMPGTVGGDSIIMQYFNGVDIDYGSLVVVSKQARELLAYIERNTPYAA